MTCPMSHSLWKEQALTPWHGPVSAPMKALFTMRRHHCARCTLQHGRQSGDRARSGCDTREGQLEGGLPFLVSLKETAKVASVRVIHRTRVAWPVRTRSIPELSLPRSTPPAPTSKSACHVSDTVTHGELRDRLQQ